MRGGKSHPQTGAAPRHCRVADGRHQETFFEEFCRRRQGTFVAAQDDRKNGAFQNPSRGGAEGIQVLPETASELIPLRSSQ